MKNFGHVYHLVTLSPWPLMGSFSLMNLLMGFLMYFNELEIYLFFIGYLMLLLVLFQWWRDVLRESTYQGFHSLKVMEGIRLGMILFIISELMFFVSFFWTYFHMFLSPSVEVGMNWPPKMIIVFNPYNVPLFNTMMLLSSGFTITWCHYSMMNNKVWQSKLSFMLTIILGLIFSFFQYLEYKESFFSFTDSIYGSIFFMSTGFHGLHVLIGTMFIMIMMLRLMKSQFSKIHHFGFEAASWYWHFVDVVWLFLYLFIYWLSY